MCKLIMENKLLETLKSVGLTNGEARVYVALLSLGTSSVSPIVESSGISSSKVYFILNRLASKGLASISVKEKRRIYTASEPERILDYLNERAQILNKHKKEISKIIPELKSKRETVSNYPPIEFTKGEKGFESVFNEVYNDLKEGDSYVGIGGLRISFKMQHYWYKQSELLSKKKVSQGLIYESDVWYKKDQSIAKRKKRKNYYPKVLSEQYKDLPNILVFGDKSIITDVDDSGEVFTLFVRNSNLSKSLGRLVKMLYNIGKVPEGYKIMPKEKKVTI